MKTFPELYHKTSKGNINVWNVWADGDRVFTRWGKQDGKMQENSYVVEQKNVGKANETSLEQQAEFEAQAMWTHKLERKYVETLEETQDRIFLPMLAKSFEKRKKFVTDDMYPVYGQPKLDGVRCLAAWAKSADGQDYVKLFSRSGKEYFLKHISEELAAMGLPDDGVTDGELYIHGVSLQQLNRLVRGSHKYPEESIKVEYHIYDYPDDGVTDWASRLEALDHFFDNTAQEKVKRLLGRELKDINDVYTYHAECRQNGYEGSIVRFYDGLYKFGYRSDKLLKVKTFIDQEFPIVGYKHYVVNTETFGDLKCVKYICQNESKTGGRNGDGTFEVVPRGSFEERAQMLVEADDAVGEQLKVEFADWTEDLIPQFPIGLTIRYEEDMDPKK